MIVNFTSKIFKSSLFYVQKIGENQLKKIEKNNNNKETTFISTKTDENKSQKANIKVNKMPMFRYLDCSKDFLFNFNDTEILRILFAKSIQP